MQNVGSFSVMEIFRDFKKFGQLLTKAKTEDNFPKILSIIMTASTNLDFFVIFSLIWETKEVQSSLWQPVKF